MTTLDSISDVVKNRVHEVLVNINGDFEVWKI